VTGLRTSDRWASVRSDDRGGRELQMGERRTAMREDARGTELRIEDRWASVRREEARREAEGPRREEPRREEPRREAEGPRRSAASRERERDWSEPDDRGQQRERPAGRAALPAGPSDRSGEWTRRWESGGRDDDRSQRGRTGEWSDAAREDERTSRIADRPTDRGGDRSAERSGRRYRVDDTDYRWNGVREEARGQTGRRLVEFEGNDDRWR
jgi:hypothetical protein